MYSNAHLSQQEGQNAILRHLLKKSKLIMAAQHRNPLINNKIMLQKYKEIIESYQAHQHNLSVASAIAKLAPWQPWVTGQKYADDKTKAQMDPDERNHYLHKKNDTSGSLYPLKGRINFSLELLGEDVSPTDYKNTNSTPTESMPPNNVPNLGIPVNARSSLNGVDIVPMRCNMVCHGDFMPMPSVPCFVRECLCRECERRGCGYWFTHGKLELLH